MARRARLALDLEETLISSAMSQIPRPGLREFLRKCTARFDTFLYTCVRTEKVQEILRTLVEYGDIDPIHAGLACVSWDPRQERYKDLSRVPGEGPVYLVDDCVWYVHSDQQAQWIQIQPFDPTKPDDELNRIWALLESMSL
jgi:hypothetical protein